MDYNVQTETYKVLNNYIIVLRKGQTTLAIELQDQNTSKYYECQITDDYIVGLTDNLYYRTQQLYEGLVASLRRSEDIGLSMSQDPKFTFVYKVNMGGFDQLFSFVIPLTEKRTVSTENPQKIADSDKKIMELQKEIGNLKAINNNLQAGLAEQEKIIMEKIEMKPQNVVNDCKFISPCFDSEGTLISKFNLSQDKKTIVRTQHDSPWYPILAKDELPKKGKVKFSTKILGTAARDIMVGLVTKGLKDHVNTHERVGCYLFTVGANGVWRNGAWRDTPDKDFVTTGDVITTIVDMDNHHVIFELNGVRKRDISIDPVHIADLRPCFTCYAIKDSVKFL